MIEVNDLTVEMTNRCNLSCPYCFAESNTKTEQLSVEEIKKAISIVKPKRAVAFSGGEPLLRQDDVIEIIPHAFQYAKRVRIETNGTIPVKWDKLLVDGNKKDIRFNTSLDGYKEVTDARRGIGVFDKVTNLIREANEHGYIIFGKATFDDDVLLNDTDHLYEFAKFCKELGMVSMRFGNVKDSGRGKKIVNDDYRDVIIKMSENIFNASQRVEKEYNCTGLDGYGYVAADLCGRCNYERNDLILGVDGILRLECQFLNVPLCHYTRYTPQLHEAGLYFMKMNNLGMTFDKLGGVVPKGKSVFDVVKK